MAQLRLRSVSKRYHLHEVIRDLDLEIETGEFVVLVGPSGCGKSTLLRMIAGLEEISGGEIEIDGKVVNDTRPKDRDLAMVFQSYALYPHMTVAENMGYALKIAGVSRDVRDQQVREVAEMLDLAALLDRRPSQLSGGQRQRVAMGRAMVRRPKVFLFDEPLSNLDTKLRVSMRSEIKALHQSIGNTAIYVTHDQIEAMTMADRVVVMNQGRIEQLGKPIELYDRPANLFVATFIGSPAMSLCPGQILRNGDEVAVRLDCGPVWPVHGVTGVADGTRVIVGVRPEHMHLYEQDEESREGSDVTVRLVEPTGADTEITVDLGGVTLHVKTRTRVTYEPGQRLKLIPEPEALHVFGAEDGLRLN